MSSRRFARSALRVVVDTNVWVSGLILPRSAPGAVLAAARERRFTVIASWELAEELVEVLARPKLARYGITAADVADVLRLLAPTLPATELDLPIRDPGDAPVVGAAVAGRARAIVTGDRDLFEDAIYSWLREREVDVLRPADLMARL